MLFADFKNYKIVKDFKFTTKGYLINPKILIDAAVLEIKNFMDKVFTENIKEDPLAVNYVINLQDLMDDANEANEEESGFFLGFVNIACAEFFRMMIKNVERKTEYRLDVPENLKGLHMSYSLMKKACNHELVNDVFNLTITYKNLTFSLCDQDAKRFEDIKEFKHTVDELENKHE